MSRTRKAAIGAAFGYAQFALAFATGLVSLPLTLHYVDASRYGLWLAAGELLAHSSIADAGVMNVLPWIVAQQNGANDEAGLRETLVSGIVIGVLAGVLFVAVALALATGAAHVIHGRTPVGGEVWRPLLVLIVVTGASYPLRAFLAVLAGLQDVEYLGRLNIAQTALGFALLVGLLPTLGLYALALSSSMPFLIATALSVWRLHRVRPDLIAGWRTPRARQIAAIARDGAGTWMGSIGWRMVVASSSMVLVAVGAPVAAVTYAATAKAGDMLMHLAWVPADNGLVGLAELQGQRNLARLKRIALLMLRLLLLGAGAAAVGVLAFNPVFVAHWTGADRFAGYALNTLLAALIIAHSLTHGLLTVAATVASRVRVGILTLVQGTVSIGAAWLLARTFGAAGVAGGYLLTSLVTALPVGFMLLTSSTGARFTEAYDVAIRPWTLRAIPALVLAGLMGPTLAAGSLSVAVALTLAITGLYLLAVRPLLADFPLPVWMRLWLVRAKLLPESP